MSTTNSTNAVRFADTSRILTAAATEHGWEAPSFRSPPRVAGIDRSILRRADGTHIVSVRLAGRDHAFVVADMVDGIIAANGLVGMDAERARRTLRDAASDVASIDHRAA